MLLCVAAGFLALAGSGWWMQQVLFEPDTSRAAAGRIFDDEELAGSVATLVANYTGERAGIAADQLTEMQIAAFEPMLADPVAHRVLEDLVADAHAFLVGADSEPVVLSGLDLVFMVRTEAVGDLAPLPVGVEQSNLLDTTRRVVALAVPISAGMGLLLLIAGIAARPTRDDILFAAATLAVLGAMLLVGLAYAVPRFAVPLLVDGVWVTVISAGADHQLPAVAITAIVLAVAGVVLGLASYGVGRRRTKGWSAPVRTSRYNEQRQWSR